VYPQPLTTIEVVAALRWVPRTPCRRSPDGRWY